MSEETKKPFCVRGHARKKKGPCPVCVSEWRNRLRQDPESYAAYKFRKNEREHKLMPLTKPMKDHAKAVAERLLAKADELAKRERVTKVAKSG